MKVTLNERLVQKLTKATTENKNKVKVTNETKFNVPSYVKKTVNFSEQLADTFTKKVSK